MAENSGILWTTHTFNPWIGCTKVGPACDSCYAEAWDTRFSGGEHWGPHASRKRTRPGNWSKPRTWNHAAATAGRRDRVFTASLADIFDNHRSIEPAWREDLWALIRATPALDWLILTKRPQNIARFLPQDWGPRGYANVWLGATVENQVEFDRRVPFLVDVPARVHFLSMEPLLGSVYIGDAHGLDWIIAGGENAANFRPSDPDWFRSLRDQCAARQVPFFFKQWSGPSQPAIKALGRELDGVIHDAYPLAA